MHRYLLYVIRLVYGVLTVSIKSVTNVLKTLNVTKKQQNKF